MNSVFFELTVVLILASILSIIFRLIKQPSILAYILAGIIIGPIGLFHIENKELLRSMAEIGVALLLFMLGLELKVSELKSVGKIAALAGLGQIIFTSIIGFLIVLFVGFSVVASIYISIALTFSSTIIIVKLLSDKRDLNSLYGKISIGILLVQDFFAIIALIVLAGLANSGGSFSFDQISFVLIKAVVLFGATVYLSQKVFPILVRNLARSGEILFLFSIAWAFGISALVSSPFIGFSIEIGGFIAGLALANTAQSVHIASRARSLRDFFIIVFFVTLGMGMVFEGIDHIIIPGVLLSLFVLVGNPLIVMIILGFLGYRKRTLFLAGVAFAQVSEFSLILIFMGSKLGHLNNEVVALITLVSIITFGASTYIITNSNLLYKRLSPYLSLFEKRNSQKESDHEKIEIDNHIILGGASRAGQSILEVANSLKNEKILVIDFDPDVVKKLLNDNILTVFGDISDNDILAHSKADKAKIFISTVTDIDDNIRLLENLKRIKSKAKILMLAHDLEDSKILYEKGADFVVIPHVASGKDIAKLLKENKLISIDEEIEEKA